MGKHMILNIDTNPHPFDRESHEYFNMYIGDYYSGNEESFSAKIQESIEVLLGHNRVYHKSIKKKERYFNLDILKSANMLNTDIVKISVECDILIDLYIIDDSLLGHVYFFDNKFIKRKTDSIAEIRVEGI